MPKRFQSMRPSTGSLRLGLVLVLGAGLCACSNGGSTSPGNMTPPASPQPPEALVSTPYAELFCPPCQRIVFTSSRDGNPEIYTVNIDGTELARLTVDAANDDHAAWSPDGNRIAFTSSTGDDSKLVVMNADGSNIVRHALPHSVRDPVWTPDGTRITYSGDSGDSMDIWMVDADGGWPLLLFSKPGFEGHPSWTPDGTKLALVSDWFAYDFVWDVFLIDPDGAGFAPLTDGNIFDHMDYLWPSWSPDGARLGVTLSRETSIDRFVAYIGVINRDGTDLAPLIPAAPSSKTSWSPDGTMIAFTSVHAGTLDVSWVKADGSAWGTFVTNGWNPDWQQ
ncbi:MAG: hypothetical protein OEV41_13765 [Gammaproteobacteria bacterium]|nr:hypothetical protein [Gammaproteobacteria bacterium]MDH5344354.1 hypothetical protein [Gammaproteobacteria bacterium]